jgi:hypothetical protein
VYVVHVRGTRFYENGVNNAGNTVISKLPFPAIYLATLSECRPCSADGRGIDMTAFGAFVG